MSRRTRGRNAAAAAALLLVAATAIAAAPPHPAGRLDLAPCSFARGAVAARCGTFTVWEDHESRSGRTLDLRVVVLPSRAAAPRPEPVLYLAGGPGGSAVRMAEYYAESWMRDQHDIVLVDQRGTGASHPLQCELPGGDDDLQGYLDGDFSDPARYDRCAAALSEHADLTRYATPDAITDLEQLRAALGYERVNLLGNSWGTRTALIYLRMHPGSVRAAVLNSIVPVELPYPLYHAAGAQEALDTVLDECATDAACAEAFPDLGARLDAVLAGLSAGPRQVAIRHPETGEPVTVSLSQQALREGIRYLMWSVTMTRWLPAYVQRAYEGDYAPLAELVVGLVRAFRPLKVGLLMSVICAEDVRRIDPDRIAPLTDGSFYGDARVRQTLAACERWPVRDLPAGYGEPVRADTPVLIWGGTLDSASRPAWALAAAEHLSHSRVVIVPGAHTPDGGCLDEITRSFLAQASVEVLDTRCVDRIELPPFELAFSDGGSG